MSESSSAVPNSELNHYKVVIQMGSNICEGVAGTPLEALFLAVPDKTNAKAVITVSKGERKWEVAYRPLFLKRLFLSPAQQELFNGRATKMLQ